MNNDQFRKLIFGDKPSGSSGSPPAPKAPGATPALGSRKHASIPMTPRQVGRTNMNAEFARQLAERNAKANPTKKPRSAAPKGVKLAAGYTDRTLERKDDAEDERAQRIKRLEEALKLQQIDRAMFTKMVSEIAGGDVESTHLVRGLDRKLLERVRRGEDVRQDESKEEEEEEAVEDDEFDRLVGEEVQTIVREKVEKKGEMAPPPPVAGVKRSRNDILAEFKRQRQEAAEAAAAEHQKKYPTLRKGFRRIGLQGETSRIEIDDEGREILVITDANGNVKRKVKKQKVENKPAPIIRTDFDNEELNKYMAPLPVPPEKKEESEDEDIFEGVGTDYNPLADLDASDSDSSDEEGDKKKTATVESEAEEGEDEPSAKHTSPPPKEGSEGEISSTPPSPQPSTSKQPTAPPARRNWFNDQTPSTSGPATATADATVLAALKKVRTLDPSSSLLQDSEEARLAKRAAMLAARDRDMEDLDMGFGGSRFDDADDMEQEGEKVKFSEWKGLGEGGEDDDDGGNGARGGKKRKRGPKKKKGDKNSAADVLRVMERQKEKGKTPKTLG